MHPTTRPSALVGVVAGATALALVTLSAGCGNREAEAPPTTTVVTTTAPPATTTAVTTTAPPAAGTAAQTATTAPPTNDTNAGPGGPTGTGADIAGQINARIVRNTQMTGSRVTAVVDDAGVATLNGFVQNQQQKALAAKAAENTPGVVSVKNKLEIRPTGGAGKTPKTPPPVQTKVIVVPATPAPSGTARTGAAPEGTGTGAAEPTTTEPGAEPTETTTPGTTNPPAPGPGQ